MSGLRFCLRICPGDWGYEINRRTYPCLEPNMKQRLSAKLQSQIVVFCVVTTLLFETLSGGKLSFREFSRVSLVSPEKFGLVI